MAELVLQYITPHSCHNLAKVPIVHPGLPFFSQLARERQLRCRCQQQRAPSLLRQPADKLPQRPCDKATQTYWRPPSHAVSPHIHTQVHTLNIILDFFFFSRKFSPLTPHNTNMHIIRGRWLSSSRHAESVINLVFGARPKL